jgi:hypothetical protein
MELHRLWDAFAHLHAAASAIAGLIGADIRVHGADENFVLRPQKTRRPKKAEKQ